jgi:hypothetical protein
MALADPSFGTGGEAILAEPGVGIFFIILLIILMPSLK